MQTNNIVRLIYERNNFARMAAAQRKRAIEYRRRKDFLAALQADDKASEYRRSREQWNAEIKHLRAEGANFKK